MMAKKHIVNFPDPAQFVGFRCTIGGPADFTYHELGGLVHVFDSSEALEAFTHAMNGASIEERVNNAVD
jgi:hypothetical protein